MTNSEFLELADETLANIVEVIDNCGLAIDYESDNAGALTLYFETGSEFKIAIDSDEQRLTLQCDSGNYRFEYDSDADTWQCDGVELLRILSRECSELLGEDADLQA